MATYGLPYMGSKTRLCKWLIDMMPSGRRFCDLFGGGGAMSHYAILCGKYDSVLYNEYDPAVVKFMRDCLAGKYLKNPKYVTRQEFMENREKDAYYPCVWGFGNMKTSYIVSYEREEINEIRFDYVVNDIWNEKLPCDKDILKGIEGISNRRNAFRQYFEKTNYWMSKINEIERIERCNRMSGLNIDVNNGSYSDYEFVDGDVVYCDPPYHGTAGYEGTNSGNTFNHKDFFNWALNADFPVYFSCYEIPDNRFSIIGKKTKSCFCNPFGSAIKKNEFLYGNKHAKQYGQLNLFSVF